MYRSTDGGETWEQNENGLPSGFGFPIALDRGSHQMFAVPLESDEYRMPVDGALAVYRSRDRGGLVGGDDKRPATGACATWAYCAGALAVDHMDPCGVYFGTTAGTVYFSNGRRRHVADAVVPAAPRNVRRSLHRRVVMASVTVELPSVLDEVMKGQRSISVEADTLRSALDSVTQRHPQLAVHLFDETGGFRQHVLCFHNQTNTRWLEDWNVALSNGDTIRILQAVSGG